MPERSNKGRKEYTESLWTAEVSVQDAEEAVPALQASLVQEGS